jgi:hypothetical protein
MQLDEEVALLKNNLAGVEGRLGNVEGRVTDLESNVETRFDHLEEICRELRADVNLNNDLAVGAIDSANSVVRFLEPHLESAGYESFVVTRGSATRESDATAAASSAAASSALVIQSTASGSSGFGHLIGLDAGSQVTSAASALVIRSTTPGSGWSTSGQSTTSGHSPPIPSTINGSSGFTTGSTTFSESAIDDVVDIDRELTN